MWVAPPTYILDDPWRLLPGPWNQKMGSPWRQATSPEDRTSGARCLLGSSVDTRDQGCNITKRSILCIREAGRAVICEQDL